jgi:hypothetical protein
VARARKEGKAKRNRGNQVKRIKMIENNIKILNSIKEVLKESK